MAPEEAAQIRIDADRLWRLVARGQTATTRPAAAWSVSNRMVATIRFALALSALLIIFVDPSEPDRLVEVTYTALGLYSLYSAALLVFEARRRPLLPLRVAHWVDVAWFTLLIALSSGTSSVFFFFYFFAILVASFRWGFRAGVASLVASVVLFTTVGYLTAPSGPGFELNRFLLRPVYLLLLGYMMAIMGGSEVTLRRRLALLKDVTTLSNPRFGTDRTVGAVLERLRAFFDAESASLLVADAGARRYTLRRTDRRNPEAAMRGVAVPPAISGLLAGLPSTHAVVYDAEARPFRRGARARAYDVTTGEAVMANAAELEALATTLDAGSFVTVPFRYDADSVGRLYVATRRLRAFDRSDVEFLLQVVDQVMPVVENIRLVDRLASDAAEQERQKIARDIHDSVIQPYIGLQLGLSAVLDELRSGDGDVAADVARLVEMTQAEIGTLRRYVGGLKASGESDGSLVPAIRRFGAKFAEATGIDVSVEAHAELAITDRLAAEAFQMVAEGLSNVRRHTHAREVSVRVACADGRLELRIENDHANGAPPAAFTPRSIAERAAALGGRALVEDDGDGRTALRVEIPL